MADSKHIVFPSLDFADRPQDLRSKVNQNPGFTQVVDKDEIVLGDKAVGGLDDDKDHLPNVVSGLKASDYMQNGAWNILLIFD